MSRSRYKKKKEKNIPYVYIFVALLIAVVMYLVIAMPFTATHPNGKTIVLKPPSSLNDVPFLTGSSYPMHIHVHLDIYANGTSLTIPASWGYNNLYYAIHTHDTLGIIHIESPVVKNYTLGQIFEVFGYPAFNSTTCLNYTKVPVLVYVNGVQNSSYGSIVLVPHSEIAVIIGNRPASIPASYSFPAGYDIQTPVSNVLLASEKRDGGFLAQTLGTRVGNIFQ